MNPLNEIGRSINYRFQNARCSLLDFRTKRHIIVIESDDWGSIRIPSKEIWVELLRRGYSVDKRPYERYDTLESESDLTELFNIMLEFQDSKGNPPCITANMVMSNPDFSKIKGSGFADYYYRSLNETYCDYYGNNSIIPTMMKGRESKLFCPQSHGMEHFNLPLWMKDLKNQDPEAIETFDLGICGLAPKVNPQLGNKYMIAFRTTTEKELRFVLDRVKMGLEEFEKTWGYKSTSFVSPCYTWNDEIEGALFKEGVKMIQTSRCQKISDSGSLRYHYTGEIGGNAIFYSVRNCFFEPSLNDDYCLASTIKQIEDAFHKNKIAVISSHRINYVSGLSMNRRDNNLDLLRQLLSSIVSRWNDVEFFSSAMVCDLLKSEMANYE